MSPSTQIYQELKNSCTLTIVTDNIEGNINTLYNGCNTAKKQLEPYWLSLGQLESQAKNITLKSSPKLEILEEYTDVFNQGINWNPFKKPPAYNQYNSGIQIVYKLTRSTPLGNLI